MIALLVDGPLNIRVNKLVDALNEFDEENTWSHTAPGLDGDPDAVTSETLGLIAEGPTGGLVTLMDISVPLDAGLVQEACARSWWYQEGERAAAHRGHWLIAGGATDSWKAAVLRAKVSTLIAALVIHDNPSVVAVWNGVVGTLFTPDNVRGDLRFIARDQVPIMFWTHCALHSLEDGDVSMSTAGMKPFVGYEIEIWNAPRTAQQVNEQLNAVLNYLLDRGPVISAGQTIGRDGDPETLYCEFGPSRAERNEPVEALFLTYLDGEPEAAAPPKPKSKSSFLGKLFGRA